VTDSTPRTLLSFIYNTTGLAAYRREMHLDMRDAFKRFGISDGAVRDACYEIEEAAYEMRTFSTDRLARKPTNLAYWRAARAKMFESTRVLFGILSEDLAFRVVNPPSNDATAAAPAVEFQPDRYASLAREGEKVVVRDFDGDLREPYLLLDYLYFFFHYPQLQAQILASKGLEAALDELNANPAGKARELAAKAKGALQALAAGQRASKSADIRAFTDDVCAALAQEYCDRASQKCW
jgi:hypothetical protein